MFVFKGYQQFVFGFGGIDDVMLVGDVVGYFVIVDGGDYVFGSWVDVQFVEYYVGNFDYYWQVVVCLFLGLFVECLFVQYVGIFVVWQVVVE